MEKIGILFALFISSLLMCTGQTSDNLIGKSENEIREHWKKNYPNWEMKYKKEFDNPELGPVLTYFSKEKQTMCSYGFDKKDGLCHYSALDIWNIDQNRIFKEQKDKCDAKYKILGVNSWQRPDGVKLELLMIKSDGIRFILTY